MSMIEDALEIALRGHKGQVDKAGSPYILHPLHVMGKMGTDELKVVALLHDVLEDTGITLGEIQKKFPPRVVAAVVALTREVGETYKQYIVRLGENELAREVKREDLKHNMDSRRLAKTGMSKQAQDSLVRRYMEALVYLNVVEDGVGTSP